MQQTLSNVLFRAAILVCLLTLIFITIAMYGQGFKRNHQSIMVRVYQFA
jgi:hypothetical protein